MWKTLNPRTIWMSEHWGSKAAMVFSTKFWAQPWQVRALKSCWRSLIRNCRRAYSKGKETCLVWEMLFPSQLPGSQTWLAGKSPNKMEAYSWEMHRSKWCIFQLAMFDCQRVEGISYRYIPAYPPWYPIIFPCRIDNHKISLPEGIPLCGYYIHKKVTM